MLSKPEADPAGGLLTPPRTPSSSTEDLPPIAPQDEASVPEAQCDILICAMHFIGDGMALHTFANDFFGLLGSDRSDADLNAMLQEDWEMRWRDKQSDVSSPSS